jgi:MFS family permease
MQAAPAAPGSRYKWVALSNTTMGTFMAGADMSIVLISMPAIFRGIGLDPLAPGNVAYLLWLMMGYTLVTAVCVVSIGRFGDMVGRVRVYNLGFVVFTLASLALSVDPFLGSQGALWLIVFRLVQAVGGSMLMANSAAILTDAFPVTQRGMALGINQIAVLAGQFTGLVLGGLLAAIDWHAVFWINVPVGVVGTIWAYRSLRETSARTRGRIDWLGNLTFGIGCAALLIAITYGIQPYQGNAMGWGNPKVIAGLVGGVVLLGLFCVVEMKVADPMFRLALFKIRAFTFGSAASLLSAVARGGMQFMLIVWLQGVWLPLHGVPYSETPLLAGIALLPLTAGFLAAGPISGILSDRFGARVFATAGQGVFMFTFIGLLLLPIDFSYWMFALLIFLSGVGSGMFTAPNTAAIMSSVPARDRGAASGMRATFQNSGTSLSMGIFFSLLIAGLSTALPGALRSGLIKHGVPASVAGHVASLPPSATIFSAFLGANPLKKLLEPTGVLQQLPPSQVQVLTGTHFFPELIAPAVNHGLGVVFIAAAILTGAAGIASAFRGKRFLYQEQPVPTVAPAPPQPAAREAKRAS